MQRKFGDVFGRNVARMNLIVMRFGNIPVLAEKAAHIAARGAHTEHASAGKKMIERLLLDGINLQSCGRAVTEAEKLAILIYTDEAKTGLAGPMWQ